MTSELQSPDIWNQVKGLFGRSDASEAVQIGHNDAPIRNQPASASSQGDAGEQDQFLSDRSDFEARLQGFLSRNETSSAVVGGKVHLLNIQEIRDKFGSRWDKLSVRVHKTVNDTLKYRLGRNDFFTRYESDAYVIVFGGSSEQEAKLKCALLADEIKAKLFGEDESELADSLGVETVTTQVDGSLATEKFTSADALAALLEKAADNSSASSEQVVGPSPYADRALTPEEVKELLGMADSRVQALECDKEIEIHSGAAGDRLEELIRQLRNFRKALAAADTGQWIEDTERLDRQPTSDWKSQYFSELSVLHKLTERAENQLARRQRQTTSVYEAEEKNQSSLATTFSYVPIWHVSKQTVGAHFCQVSLEFDKEIIPHTKLVQEDLGSELPRIIDLIVVQKAHQDLKEALKTGTVHIVGVPIHYSTLDGLGSRREFEDLCRAIPPDLRNVLIWEIVNSPIGAWRTHLPRAISTAKPFARAIFLRTDLIRSNFSEIVRSLKYLRAAGVHAVGIDLSGMPISESDAIAILERFAATAQRCGLMRYAFGLDSLSLVTAAVCAGFDHVAGLTVAKPTDLPGGISPTTTESLYIRSFGQNSS